ncbi:unnamed protein product [Linum trigynum]|uniref:Uncharacterized protein n=1 Tax=Linum trigynum TaxID=586398 RepID=A0AAV2DE66_9ROSI
MLNCILLQSLATKGSAALQLILDTFAGSEIVPSTLLSQPLCSIMTSHLLLLSWQTFSIFPALVFGQAQIVSLPLEVSDLMLLLHTIRVTSGNSFLLRLRLVVYQMT